ncbi:MAG: hypothetical protein O7G88_02820 [bacterium]|nr:hypothetical protein [bacterium]
MVAAVVQSREIPESVLQSILAKAAGNPFFLEELTRTVGEQGDDQQALALPDTVRTVLTARMDRLPPESKHLLQVAAVIGPGVCLSLLQAVTEYAEAALYDHLRALQGNEFLIERR